MVEKIWELLNNEALWLFLGTFVTAYLGYKGLVRKMPNKAIRKANSFEEVIAVVELLQKELEKKDKRHKEDTEYLLGQVRDLRTDNRELAQQLVTESRRSSELTNQIEKLNRRLRKYESTQA